jgi:hypothetical protein
MLQIGDDILHLNIIVEQLKRELRVLQAHA